MKIIIEPTPEIFDAPINGVTIPLRVWIGTTEGGVPIEAYVLSIVPQHPAESSKLKAELPPFMRPSRDAFTIDTGEDKK